MTTGWYAPLVAIEREGRQRFSRAADDACFEAENTGEEGFDGGSFNEKG
jgi:hypothetical protein